MIRCKLKNKKNKRRTKRSQRTWEPKWPRWRKTCFHRRRPSGTFHFAMSSSLKRPLLKVLNSRCEKQWLLGFPWKIMAQVFLEDSRRLQGQSNLGKVPLGNRLVQPFTWAVQQLFSPRLFFSPCDLHKASVITMFVLVNECQHVLMKPSTLSESWVIDLSVAEMTAMTPCFSSLSGFTDNLLSLDDEGQEMWSSWWRF